MVFDDRDRGGWYLGAPIVDPSSAPPGSVWETTENGARLDPKIFCRGERVELSARPVVPIERRGKPRDCHFGSFDMLVVSQRVGALVETLAPGDVQRIPVDVEGVAEPYEILNVVAVLDRIDPERTAGQRWPDDHPHNAGRWRAVYELVLRAEDLGGPRIFRLSGWSVGVVVTEEIKRALQNARVSGIRFVPIKTSEEEASRQASLVPPSSDSGYQWLPPWRARLTPAEWHSALEAHCENVWGRGRAFGEIVQGDVPVTLYEYGPSRERAWRTLRTGGVSDRPLAVPKAEDHRRYSEFLLYLPAQWDAFGDEAGGDQWWPAGLLRHLGSFVHEAETYFAPGHSVRVADPGAVYSPGTPFQAAFLLPPWFEPKGFDDLQIEGIPCRFLWVCPITEAETDLLVNRGANALLSLMGERRLSHIIDPNRACLVTGNHPRKVGRRRG
ncbi:MAG: suppressor of fused domain protein [Acidimicrobiales bacterium]